MGVNAKRITRVPCGFDFNDSGNGAEFRGRHALTGPVVLFLGRKTKAKGVERLLEAWPEVVARFPEATLVFAGPGAGKERKLADGSISWPLTRGLSRRLGWQLAGKKAELAVGSGQWAGEVNGKLQMADGGWARSGGGRILDLDDLTEEEKQDALAACNVLCVPSEGESFGMVYFEAWAYGKPVVALDLPVLRETIGAADAGLVVRNETKEIAQGINRLLGDAELRSRLGANGRRLAIGHKWNEAAKHYLRGYAEAMRTKIL
jgi:glycosyltransferase involved in cell wall biosynthesis